MADVDEFGVNYFVLATFILAVISTVWGRRLGARLRGSRFVHRFGQLVAGGGEPIDSGVDPVGVVLPMAFLVSSMATSISFASASPILPRCSLSVFSTL